MSAAIVKLKYPDVKLIGWNYGDPVHPSVGLSNEDIIMADISFLPEVMLALHKTNNLVWIDHHERTIIEIDKYLEDEMHTPLKGLRDPKFAACELTWKYLFPNAKIPELVRLLGRYDCFGHKGTDEEQKVLEFQYGARVVITNPEEALQYLKKYLDSEYNAFSVIEEIAYKGKSIYSYLCTEAKQKYAQKFDIYLAEPIKSTNRTNFISAVFARRKFACVNVERFNPVNFGIDYHKDGYDGFACFWLEGGNWNYSLYNDNGDVDCSAIAKRFGGGGHKGASGFRVGDIFKEKYQEDEKLVEMSIIKETVLHDYDKAIAEIGSFLKTLRNK